LFPAFSDLADFLKIGNRVSDFHSFHTDPDPGFEIYADPYGDPRLDFYQKITGVPGSVFHVKKIKMIMDPDQNADPDPGTPKMRI